MAESENGVSKGNLSDVLCGNTFKSMNIVSKTVKIQITSDLQEKTEEFVTDNATLLEEFIPMVMEKFQEERFAASRCHRQSIRFLDSRR